MQLTRVELDNSPPRRRFPVILVPTATMVVGWERKENSGC